MSATGQWLMAIFLVVVIAASLLHGLWWPRLERWLAQRLGMKGVSEDINGKTIPLLVYFFLFPMWSLFSSDPNAWWLFMVFGYGMIFVIVVSSIYLRRAEREISEKHRKR